MKSKHLRIIHLFFSAAILFLSPLNAQVEEVKQIDEKETEWQPGYVVLKKHTDTLKGYLNIITTDLGYIKKVFFRKDKMEKKRILKFGDKMPLPKDTLRFFGIEEKRYYYLNQIDDSIPATSILQERNNMQDWVQLLEKGTITISFGFSVIKQQPLSPSDTIAISNGVNTIYKPLYCLKKADNPVLLITGYSNSLLHGNDLSTYKVDDRNKKQVIQLIGDDKELVEKIKKEKLLFMNVEKYVKEYNSWAADTK